MHIDSIDVYFSCFLFPFREKLIATVYLYVVKAEYFTLKLRLWLANTFWGNITALSRKQVKRMS